MPIDAMEAAHRWTYQAFAGGMNSYVPAHVVPANQVVAAKNCLLQNDLTLERRPGFKLLGTTLSDDPGRALAIRSAGYGTSSKIWVVYGETSAYQRTWNGSTWGLVGETYLSTGEPTTLSRVRKTDGTEWIWTASGNTDIVETKIEVANPPTAVKIDLTAGDTNAKPPLAARFLVAAVDRLWTSGAAGIDRGKLYYSLTIPNNDIWDRAQYVLEPVTNDGQPIVTVLPYKNNMVFLGYAGSCYLVFVGGGSVFDWELRTVSNSIGCASIHGAVNVTTDVLFFDQYGRLQSLEALINQGANAAPLSIPIQDVTDAAPATDLHLYALAHFKDSLWAIIPTATDVRNLYTYNTKFGGWTGPHEIKNASGQILNPDVLTVGYGSPGVATNAPGDPRLYIAGRMRTALTWVQVFTLDDDELVDAETAANSIEFEVITRAHSLDQATVDAQLDHVEIHYRADSASMNIEGRRDFGPWIDLGSTQAPNGPQSTILFERFSTRGLTTGRTFQTRVTSKDTVRTPKLVGIVMDVVSMNPGGPASASF